MNESGSPFRTVFVGELVQKGGLSVGGRDEGLQADAILARDGLDRPILRGSGLAGALLATLRDFDLVVPRAVSAGLPSGKDEGEGVESLWLVRHAHIIEPEHVQAAVRPNVAIHPWTGAAVDRLKFDTETLPRGTRWRLVVETEDWRDRPGPQELPAAVLLALALQEWQAGHCWLGRSPARGLGWAALERLRVFRLGAEAAGSWPRAEADDHQWLEKAVSAATRGVAAVSLDELLPARKLARRSQWHLVEGTLRLGERDDGYGLDSLSTLGRDLPPDPSDWEDWRMQNGWADFEGVPVRTHTELDAVPAWSRSIMEDGPRVEFMVPGSAIRGTLRSAVSSHWRRCGEEVWSPNDVGNRGSPPSEDPLLPLFGSIEHDSNLLVSDAFPVPGAEPDLHVQELHAEDEFTQGPYGSSKFNRPFLVSGTFRFTLGLREAVEERAPGLRDEALRTALQALRVADTLGRNRFLPIGGGIWRGHGWVEMKLSGDILEATLAALAKDEEAGEP